MQLSARRIAEHVAAGELSAVTLFDALMERIATENPRLNAFVHWNPEAGRAEAAAADARAARGEALPLLGVPFTVKDNIWVGGCPTTQGSRLFAGFKAPQDAVAVARLRAAGAVFAGITNCSEFACKGVTTNPLHGATRNPWNLELTPGGSSGGAASAVAAGLSPLALTTDGGGSTRRPAAHVGVVGMKPSAGIVPHPIGFAEPVFGNSVVGQMARSVGDVALMLDVLAGPDPRDPQSVAVPGRFLDAITAPDPTGLRVAYSPRLGLGFAVEPDVARCVEYAVRRLEWAGVPVEEADPVWPEGAGESGLMALQFAGLASLYGDRFRSEPGLFDPDIAVQIEAGLRTTGAEVARALHLREEAYRALGAFFTRFDLLITPTTPVTAWPLDQLGPTTIEGRPASPRGHAVFTPLLNHCYAPACSIPCGLDNRGLPVGLQIAGPRLSDARVLTLAAAMETMIGWSAQPPMRVG
ncbi:amidase [Azospirillum canadense]|uniref:amidase n=1 Tax=Azospirillum canadense TaxID=403962 RepID=UPI002227D07A|nr:amidase [Azospirillum canadense]MCW2240099.1 aspartyl-tRNA(Asn)/glutamyl-tRNA(Gln) amidotransferase subunit A [Azospirillum canadense]